MQITSVHIRNFKSIREMEIHGIENAQAIPSYRPQLFSGQRGASSGSGLVGMVWSGMVG